MAEVKVWVCIGSCRGYIELHAYTIGELGDESERMAGEEELL